MNITLIDMIIPAISALGGGVVVALLKFKSESRTDLYDRLDTDNKRLRDREMVNERNIKELQDKFMALQEKFAVLESAHHNLPIPQWIKSVDGVILSMNSHCHVSFIKGFGFSRLEVIGLTDRDIFPVEIAQMIEENDNEVKKFRKPVKGIEEIEGIEWMVMRYPVMQDGTLIAIGGIAHEKIQ